MKIWYDYKRVLNVIDSCETVQQLNVASKMLELWYDKYLDYQIYQNACHNHIRLKYSELGGSDINELSFKNVEL